MTMRIVTDMNGRKHITYDPPASDDAAERTRLRDYFAAKAMQGAVTGLATRGDEPLDYSECAALSYEMADAMLKARE